MKKNRRPARAPSVVQVMRRRFITVSPEDTLEEALQIMRMARLRHLLVAREGFLVGILTYRTLLESLFDARAAGPADARDLTRPVADAMVSLPEAVTPEQPLAHAATKLWRLRIGCLPVVEPTEAGARLLGLLTEADLLRAAYDPLLQTAS